MRLHAIGVSLLFIFCVTLGANAQVTSMGSGDWNTPGNWSCGCVPGTSDDVVISAFDVITLTSGSQQVQSLVVDSDATLNLNGGSLIVTGAITVTVGDGFFTFDGLLNIGSSGSLEGRSTVTSSSGNFQIDGIYTHNQNGGSIPDASWNSGSTLIVRGITNTAPSNINQTFYNLIWNSTHTTPISLLGQLTAIQNDFTILDTGGASNRSLILSTNTNSTLNISGNLSIQNNAILGVVQSGAYTLNINGNFTVNSSAATALLLTGTGSPIINVTGNLTKSNSGAINFASAAGGNGTINITGDLSISGGSLTETSTGSGTVNFVGSGTHFFTKSGGSILNTINFTNASSSTLDLGTSILEGGGAFTNNGTLRVGSIHASGALQNTTILDSDCGNIIVSGTRTYANPSVIVYNGGSAQIIGDGHPTSAGVDITIANPSGVSIIAPTTLAGTINLTSGNLNINNSSLTITGSITGSNKISIGVNGSLSLGGSSSIGTFPFTAGAQTFANFTLNNTNGVTFGNDVTLSGALTLTNGTLVYNNATLTLNGTLTSSAGTLSGNTSSTLAIGGTGAFGSLPTASGNTIGTLTFNRSSGTASINSSLIVNTAFNLLNGDFTNTNGLQMANGSTLTRSSNAQLLGNPPANLPAGQFYNVTYTGGALTTGSELSNTTDDMLGTLTVNSSNNVTLDKDINVNGGVNLQSGTLVGGGNDITMSSSSGSWNKTSGTFTGGAGSVIIAGNTTITASSTPNFTNIIANSGSTLTFPSGNINVSGDLQLSSTGTFNANNGTIIFNGSGDQTITGGGRTFANLTVNKSGGAVVLLPTVELTGLLNIITATTVQSNGNLILVSTTDAASGNASIGKIPAGASVTGNVSVQRYMSGETRIYRDISSPVLNPQVSQIQNPVAGSGGTGITITGPFTGSSFPCAGCGTNNPSMYFYDETLSGGLSTRYSRYPVTANTETLAPGRGYSLLVRNELGPRTLALTGTINSGPLTLPVTYHSTGSAIDDGWNLVGNPYPATIDWNASLGWTKANIQGNMISIWDAGLGQYKSWNGSTGSLNNGRIAKGQAFWIQANGSPTLNINENAKTITTGAFYKEGDIDYLEIILAKNTLDDRAYVQRMDGSSDAFDGNDGRKLQNATFNISTLSSDGQSLTFNTSDNIVCNGSLQAKVTYDIEPANVNGTYRLSINAVGQYQGLNVLVNDSFTNSSFDLTSGSEYAYEVTSDPLSRKSDRFNFTLAPKAVNLDLGVAGEASVCAGSNAMITVSNAEAGIGYYPELNGARVGDTVFGDGSDVSLIVPGNNLANGSNEVVIKAVNLCGINSLNELVPIIKDDLYAATPVGGKSCLQGSVSLSASGAPAGGTYNWYESESAIEPVFVGSDLVTPLLTKSKTYFVAAVNTLGCEGTRQPVLAEVTNYDEATIEVQGNSLVTNYSTGVQWYKDDQPINGATGSTLVVGESGNYKVEVIIGDCSTSAAKQLTVTGLEDYAKSGNTVIYPNPVVDILNVRYPGEGRLTATFFGSSGNKITSQELKQEGNVRSGSFDMTSWSQGIYYLQFSDNSKVVLLKVLKK